MPFLDKFQSVIGGKKFDDKMTEVDDPHALQDHHDKESHSADGSSTDDAGEQIDENAQSGVKKIEAVTLTWSKSSVYLTLVLYAYTHFLGDDQWID